MVYLEGRSFIPPGRSDSFRLLTKGLNHTPSKQKTIRQIESQTIKRVRILKVDLSKYFNSKVRVQAIRTLASGVTESSYRFNFFIASLILNSRARTGVVSNITLDNVYSAEQFSSKGKAYRVVSKTTHKTSCKGPVQIPLSIEEYDALRNIFAFLFKKNVVIVN